MPPSTFVLFWGPWTLLPVQAGLVVYFVAHYAAFLVAAVLLFRLHAPGLRPLELGPRALFLVSLFAPWRESIWLGQPNGFILLLVVLGLRWFLAGRTWPLAVVIAAALTLKPTTTWLLAYFLARRSLRVLIAIGVVGLGYGCGVRCDRWNRAVARMADGTSTLTPARSRRSLPASACLHSTPVSSSVLTPTLRQRTMSYLPLAQASQLRGPGWWCVVAAAPRAARRPVSDRIGKTLELGLALTLSLTLSPLTWLHYATTALVD